MAVSERVPADPAYPLSLAKTLTDRRISNLPSYPSTILEARDQFFSVRLWDSGHLIQAVLDNYERLLPEIQAELPLKKVWILVQDDPGLA
jgi:hypothetical protein